MGRHKLDVDVMRRMGDRNKRGTKPLRRFQPRGDFRMKSGAQPTLETALCRSRLGLIYVGQVVESLSRPMGWSAPSAFSRIARSSGRLVRHQAKGGLRFCALRLTTSK